MYVLIKREQQHNNSAIYEDVTYTYLAQRYVDVTSKIVLKYYIWTA